MDAEIGSFAALAVLMIGLFAWLRQDIRKLDTKTDALRGEMRSEIGSLRDEVGGIRAEIVALRERMAHLEVIEVRVVDLIQRSIPRVVEAAATSVRQEAFLGPLTRFRSGAFDEVCSAGTCRLYLRSHIGRRSLGRR